MLVYLDSSFTWGEVQDNLNDIRFGDSENNTLSYEIDSYTINTDAFLWVKLLNVSSSSDTVFYLYFGNPVSGSGANASDVWDSNFVVVHHLNDETTSTVLDSSTNLINGTKTAANEPQETAIFVGNSQDFDGVNDKIVLDSDSKLNFGTDDLTLEAFVNFTSWASSLNTIFGGSSGGCAALVIDDTANRYLRFYKQGVSAVSATQDSLSLNSWFYVAVTFDNSETTNNVVFTVDDSEHTKSWDQDFSAQTNQIGAYQSVATRYPNSLFDEVRFSDVVRSTSWKKASYHSGFNTLLTQGTIEIYESGVYGNDLSIEDVFVVVFLFAIVALAVALAAIYKKLH